MCKESTNQVNQEVGMKLVVGGMRRVYAICKGPTAAAGASHDAARRELSCAPNWRRMGRVLARASRSLLHV